MEEISGTTNTVIQSDLWMAGLKTFASLCFILVVVIIIMYIIKRIIRKKDSTGYRDLIKINSIYYITPKQKIGIIDVAGKKIVIGITPENITNLGEIEKDSCQHLEEENSFNRKENSVFENALKSFVKKGQFRD